MPTYKPREGESLDQFAERLQADADRKWEPPAPKHVNDMTKTERDAAWRKMSDLSPFAPQPPADLAGKKVQDMDVRERQRCAQALGIAHLFPSFF